MTLSSGRATEIRSKATPAREYASRTAASEPASINDRTASSPGTIVELR